MVSVQAPKKEQAGVQEAVYSVNELAANANGIFKTRQEVVMAALKADGKPEYTVSEAEKIVKTFLNKEVW